MHRALLRRGPDQEAHVAGPILMAFVTLRFGELAART